MAQSLVLAIEPDLRQAAIVKRIVKEKVLADVAVVDSRDAAIEAIRSAMPDVLLLSALMSPRDEDELMAHLRTLENAGHIQTHTIPQLASGLEPGEGRSSRGLFSAFSKKKKKEPQPTSGGCDPDLFAEEIRVFLQQAAEKKRELLEAPRPAVEVRSGARKAHDAGSKPQDAEAAPAAAGSAWSSPFEWKPAGERAVAPQPLRDEIPDMPFVPPAPLEPMIDPAPMASAPLATPLVEPPPTPAPVTGEPLIWRPDAVVVPPTVSLIDPEKMAAAAEPVVESIIAPVMPEPQPEPQPVVMAATEVPIVESPVLEPAVVEAPHEAAFVEAPVAVTPAPVADTHEPVHVRAEKIVALVQEQVATLDQAREPVHKNDEWTNNARDARINDRLGPLARWARKETKGTKSTPVTADDVRALIGSLCVPPAVASVTYAKGCRIRRVRVPPAGSDRSDSMGAVILSRRLLAEHRERRPSA